MRRHLAKLPGKRFVHCSEAGSATLNAERIKQLTGGDPVMAGDKHQRAFEFQPVAKLWFSTNVRPRTEDDSRAFWARVAVIPFRQTFHGREDTSIRMVLRDCAAHQEAVLLWIVDGARRYYAQQGLGPAPSAFADAMVEYQSENDRLSEFYDECCVINPFAQVQASTLHKAYTEWCQRLPLRLSHALGSRSFYQAVAKRFKKEERPDANWYRGIGLRENSSSDPDGAQAFR
jgi:putative DNA primase/helicase